MATTHPPTILADIHEEPHAPRWTKEQYYRMADAGLFEGRRVELIAGEIIEISPIGSSLATVVALVQAALQPLLKPHSFIRSRSPLNAADRSEPEPDIAVIEGEIRDYAEAHPASALLVVEISDSTLDFDRSIKANLYAAADIPEYWILNLVEKRLEIYKAQIDERYTRISIHAAMETVAPLFAPNTKIKVADLLP